MASVFLVGQHTQTAQLTSVLHRMLLCACRKVYTADEVADTVVGILDKLGVKEACVVGHSYGEGGASGRRRPRGGLAGWLVCGRLLLLLHA